MSQQCVGSLLNLHHNKTNYVKIVIKEYYVIRNVGEKWIIFVIFVKKNPDVSTTNVQQTQDCNK